jgi:DNA polymerase IV
MLSDQSSGRKIIHIDMDAFFASVEQRDYPELKGRPVVVGGDSRRSVVAAASYEARKFGVFSAMPMSQARQKCPDLVVVPPRFGAYKEISRQIRQIFITYTDLVEPLSLDEAFLDVTENKRHLPSATLIAREIKEKVRNETGLTCTAGISVNKFLAKVASGLNKPDGLTTITPDQIPAFLDQLPVEKFFGVGKVTAARMHNMGIIRGSQLKQLSLETLVRHFGKAGHYYYGVCRGIDLRPVSPSRIRKSISVERTFEEDISNRDQALDFIRDLAAELCLSLQKMDLKGRTLQLKWRYPDFTTPTRNRSFQTFTRDPELIIQTFSQLFDENVEIARGIRLLGLGISNLNNTDLLPQLTLDI